MNAREAALLSLVKWEKNGAYVNIELDCAIKKYGLGDLDKRLFCAILYGTTEKRITLDYIINKFSSRKVIELTPQMRNILRLSVYQMRYMTKIPQNAAVNEGVELAKKYVSQSSAAFANAVLRSYIRGADSIEFPPPESDFCRYLSVKYSVSCEISQLFIKNYGKRTAEKMFASFEENPPITLRVNTLIVSVEQLQGELSDNGIACEKTKYSPFGIKLKEKISTDKLFSIIKNKAIIEDEASQLAIVALSPEPNTTLIDVCAAPGGKSFSAAIQMKNSGRIYAFDLHKNKIPLIEDGAKALNIDIITAAAADSKKINEALVGTADRVLCDVPCSGLGVIAKKPDIRYKSIAENSALIKTQYDILVAGSKYVKSGGILVYSTCTLNPLENEDNIEKFLSENKDFSLDKIEINGIENNGMITFLPHLYGTDGFFAARLRKN